MRTFAETFKFRSVRGTSVGVSYGRFDLAPHPQHFSLEGLFKNWDYIGKPIERQKHSSFNMFDTVYYRTGGMK